MPRRRELALTLFVAWGLVIARSLVYLLYEQSFFDSDQATFGLMAKHIIQGRAFPLFDYGQNYLLAFDSWVAAPIFLVFGASVATLHASTVLTNLAVVTLLVVGLRRFAGLGMVGTLASVIFFAFAPPLTTETLVEPAANISPFLFVLLLWFLRDRPLWFGGVLAIGFLTREFTAYAVPVLLTLQLIRGELFREKRIRQWIVALVAAVAVWEGVQALRPYADPMGPGTRGTRITAFNESQIGNVTDRIAFIPAELPRRTLDMFSSHLPRLVDAVRANDGTAAQGHRWLFWPLSAAVVLAIGRALWLTPRAGRADISTGRSEPAWTFPAYLFGVGLTAAAAYIVTRPVGPAPERYFMLALLLPMGAVAWFMTLERRAWLRAAVVAVLVVWTGVSASDNLAQLGRFWGGRAPNPLRELADGLVARNVHVAMAGYWRAYKLTFLTDERVKVASGDFVRIEEYQRLAAAAGDALVVIQTEPCPNGERLSDWFLCRK